MSGTLLPLVYVWYLTAASVCLVYFQLMSGFFQARYAVETRLLNKDIEILLEGNFAVQCYT